MSEPTDDFSRPPIQREIDHPPGNREFDARSLDRTFTRPPRK